MIGHQIYQEKLHKPDALLDAADKLCKQIQKHAPTATAIAVRGMSGAVIGGLISAFSGLPLIIVRKDDDQRHGYYNVQGPRDFVGDYVIVDDLIDSGLTIDKIMLQINHETTAMCIGIFLYETSGVWRHIQSYQNFSVYDE